MIPEIGNNVYNLNNLTDSSNNQQGKNGDDFTDQNLLEIKDVLLLNKDIINDNGVVSYSGELSPTNISYKSYLLYVIFGNTRKHE